MSVNHLQSDFKWQSSYRKLIKIRSMNPKDCFNETIKGQPNPLYSWCNAQRRNKLRLTPKHLFQLEQINFPWESETKMNSDKWDECYEQLIVLKAIYKENWLDEYHDDEINPLTKWIIAQRKGKNKLSRERLDKLNEINFNWNNVVEDLSALWNKNFLLYKMFIDKYSTPDCELPRVKKNSVMEKWCNTQREHKDYLTEEQLNLLNMVGFEWRSPDEIKTESWEIYYDEILEYFNANNKKLPSDSNADSHLRHIKYWYKYQLSIKEQFTEEQVEKLDFIEENKRKPKASKVVNLELDLT